MEPGMCRRVRRRICRLIVEASCAESSYGTVGHCLTTRDHTVIFKVHQNIRLRRRMKTFSIPSCRKHHRVSRRKYAYTRRGRDSAPIFERRPISSALRLKNPAGFAAMHRAVGIIFTTKPFFLGTSSRKCAESGKNEVGLRDDVFAPLSGGRIK